MKDMLLCGSSIQVTAQDLIDAIKAKHGEDADLSRIELSISYEQFQCFGYDLYDSFDYRIEMESTLTD